MMSLNDTFPFLLFLSSSPQQHQYQQHAQLHSQGSSKFFPFSDAYFLDILGPTRTVVPFRTFSDFAPFSKLFDPHPFGRHHNNSNNNKTTEGRIFFCKRVVHEWRHNLSPQWSISPPSMELPFSEISLYSPPILMLFCSSSSWSPSQQQQQQQPDAHPHSSIQVISKTHTQTHTHTHTHKHTHTHTHTHDWIFFPSYQDLKSSLFIPRPNQLFFSMPLVVKSCHVKT